MSDEEEKKILNNRGLFIDWCIKHHLEIVQEYLGFTDGTLESVKERVSRNVRYLMKNQGYSGGELSDLLGIAFGTFSNKLCNNGASFNICEIVKLSDEFLVSVDDLLKKELTEIG